MPESTNAFRPETLLAIDAVKRAFAIVRRGVTANDITAKAGRDFVTVADVTVEDTVRNAIADGLGFAGCPMTRPDLCLCNDLPSC